MIPALSYVPVKKVISTFDELCNIVVLMGSLIFAILELIILESCEGAKRTAIIPSGDAEYV